MKKGTPILLFLNDEQLAHLRSLPGPEESLGEVASVIVARWLDADMDRREARAEEIKSGEARA